LQQEGPKRTRGHIFKYNIGYMQQPGAQHERGGRTRLAPSWRRPWSVVRFTAGFFVSFIVTVFVLDSVVAAQICLPKMFTGAHNGDF